MTATNTTEEASLKKSTKRKATTIGKFRSAIVGSACVVPLVFGGAAALADAFGYAYWGTHVYKDIPIPSGQLFGAVWGDGLYVHDAAGNFGSAGNLCNWHVDFDFIDLKGVSYYYDRGKTVESCSHLGQQKRLLQRNARPGKFCIRLFTAGTENVANVCHNITR